MRREDLFERIDAALAASSVGQSEDDLILALALEHELSLASLSLPEVLVVPEEFSPDDGDDEADLEAGDEEVGDEDHSFAWFSVVKTMAPLTAEQQVELATEIEAGVLAMGVLAGEVNRPRAASDQELGLLVTRGQAASQRMIIGNLGLVLYWARRTRSDNGYSIEDRFQDGVFGLMRAIEGWDHLRGYTFSTYATWHIRQQITRQQQDLATTIRVPVHVREKWAADRKTGRVSNVQLEGVRKLVYGVVPWEEVLELEIVERGDEVCHPIEELEESIAAEQIKASLLGSLGPQQRDVVESRFGFHDDEIETLDSIGKRYSVTRERIRQIESTSTKNFEFLYWSAVPWFKEAAWQQASKRFWMGGSIALLILEEPIVNDRVLAALCGVKKAFVAPVRDLLETMCQEATRRVGLYGEPMLPDDWEALLGSATMAPPEVEVEGIAEGDATTGNGPVNEAEVIFEGTG